MSKDILVDILLAIHKIDNEQAQTVYAESDKTGTSIKSILVDKGYASPMEIAKALAYQFGMEVIQLTSLDLPPSILEMVPREIAHKYTIIPVEFDNDILKIALADPLALDLIENLRFELNCMVEGIVALEDDIQRAIEKYYGAEEEKIDNMLRDIQEDNEIMINEQDVAYGGSEGSDDSDGIEDAPVIKLVNLIITEAFRKDASDIHIEPMERSLRIRYRIDGVLHEIPGPPKRLQGAVISRIKIMATLDMAEKRLPQDGRIKIRVGKDKVIDLRVSTLPANHGESVVLRILDKSGLSLGLTETGMFTDDEKIINDIISLPNGILLITGPTGSGKTTTLYSCLHSLNQPNRKIITVEDPVEYQLPGVNQVQVRSDIGLSFAHVLRSCLRQAPNIIMVGEIRDLETAEIAINAALTGHLVFSTLHTNDAPGAITRLIDQGVKPFLLASAVRGILAQRLVRKICDNCKESYQPTPSELDLLGINPADAVEVQLSRGAGCTKCGNTGYKGRCGIFEILIMNDEIQRMVYERTPSSMIRAKARETGMRTLREDGIRKVLSGATSLEEVLRITQGYED